MTRERSKSEKGNRLHRVHIGVKRRGMAGGKTKESRKREAVFVWRLGATWGGWAEDKPKQLGELKKGESLGLRRGSQMRETIPNRAEKNQGPKVALYILLVFHGVRLTKILGQAAVSSSTNLTRGVRSAPTTIRAAITPSRNSGERSQGIETNESIMPRSSRAKGGGYSLLDVGRTLNRPKAPSGALGRKNAFAE